MLKRNWLFLNRIQEYEALFDESTVFLVRSQGVGYAKPEEMINHGVTGPNVRAAGVDYDVRWAHPYSVYSELDWQPSVERSSIKGADCYDRYRVRVEEMRMSASMVLKHSIRCRVVLNISRARRSQDTRQSTIKSP